MSDASKLIVQQPGVDADLLTKIIQRSDQILIKKLSNNDRDWARYRNKHQAGVYIPFAERDGGFFPPLATRERTDSGSDPIREVLIRTIWPQEADTKLSRLVHYTSKGQETHLTRLPKDAFATLLPASFLVMGRTDSKVEFVYECLTIDSGSDEAGLLSEVFDLSADFLIGVFEPAVLESTERGKILEFADEVIAAWLAGNIEAFANDNATMPPTSELAGMARNQFLSEHHLEKLDPFELERPGDVLREISRSIEFSLFREYQRRERSVALVRLMLGDSPRPYTASDLIRKLVDEFSKIDALMLSASQQRKSRAGYSYEHHIESMLLGGEIPFEKQVILESKKRPDFVLPSLAWTDSGKSAADTGLILSAKTTLRERWKQVEREKGHRRLFLTTVDENIASNVIEDMASFGVQLVIPESLRESKLAEYGGHSNVLGFHQLCDIQIKPHLAVWRS
ncbi:MAG TPA: type II restriction endonuclease [Rhizomicrobium sp.]|nr:type II restriction endonuclease [Rhizomicrobium sp.]